MASLTCISMSTDEQGICHLQLNRPTKLNSFNLDLIRELYDAIHIIQDDPAIRCVVVSGEGKHFSSGLDILSISKDPRNFNKLLHPYIASYKKWDDYSFDLPANSEDYPATVVSSHNVIQHLTLGLRLIRVPVIAAITGVCIGIAFQFAMGADIRIAASTSTMSILESKWGLIPDVGITEVARHVIPEDALRLLTYTGDMFQGPDLLRWHLVTELQEDPLGRAMAIAQRIASRSPDAMVNAKKLFNAAYHPIVAENPLTPPSHKDKTEEKDAPSNNPLHIEEFLQRQLLGSKNQTEAVRANVEKRKPAFVPSKL